MPVSVEKSTVMQVVVLGVTLVQQQGRGQKGADEVYDTVLYMQQG